MIPNSAPAPEIISISNKADEVCCDGGGGPMGHPLVYYSFDGRDRVDCGYCDRAFIKERALTSDKPLI